MSATFAIGVFVSQLCSNLFPTQVSLCTLARNPGAYHQKMIQVRALGSVTSSQILDGNYLIAYEPNCTETDAWATIVLAESYKPGAEVDAFLDSPKQEIRKAEIVVRGEFDQGATLGCYAPRFAIMASSISLESAISSEPLPELRQHVAR